MQRAVCRVERCETLLVDRRADDADVARAGGQRARESMRSGNVQQPKGSTVWRPRQPRNVARELADFANVTAIAVRNENLETIRRARIGKKRDLTPVGRPDRAFLVIENRLRFPALSRRRSPPSRRSRRGRCRASSARGLSDRENARSR